MNFLWGNIFEHFKERRLAGIFFSTLGVFLGMLLFLAVLYQKAGGQELLQYWPITLPGIGLLAFTFLWRTVRLVRAQRLNRYKSSPLSRDELAKARSKLRKKSTSRLS